MSAPRITVRDNGDGTFAVCENGKPLHGFRVMSKGAAKGAAADVRSAARRGWLESR